jgi:phosphohistidine phosphatase
MLRVMLLRHAKAEPAIPGASDRARVLAPRGRQQATELGQFMDRHCLTPARVLVSPVARTRETWECIATALPGAPAAEYDERLYNAPASGLIAMIRDTDPVAGRSLLLVGHNPGLHQAAIELIATGDLDARQRLHEKLPPGGLVVIEFKLSEWSALHPLAGRLERFVTPGEIEAATD